MNPTAAHFTERAEHCLATGQPNLAETYMRRACDILEAERDRSLDSYPELRAIRQARAINQLTKVTIPAMRDTFVMMGKLISEAAHSIAKSFETVYAERNAVENLRKSDVAKLA